MARRQRRTGPTWRMRFSAIKALLIVVIWALYGVSLLVLKHADERSRWLYVPISVPPALIFVALVLWGVDLGRPKGLLRFLVTPGHAVFFMAVLYVLLVFFFTPAYIASIRSGDAIVHGNAEVKPCELRKLAYFGFVTAATLGYGDITPRTGTGSAATLVCVEVIEFWMFFALAVGLVTTRIRN